MGARSMCHGARGAAGRARRRTVVVLKGYPRLSETFIAQELLGLERAGFDLSIVALRRPTERRRHPVHDEIRAPVTYLPEYLHQEPLRVLSALVAGFRAPGWRKAFAALVRDARWDFSRNRFRRFGQALVLAAEWPRGGEWLHAHFIHTPASVARYASILTGVPWSCSAHAKDIWTSPAHELAEKLASARWTVTCTRAGAERLRAAGGDAPVHLSYHGLDLARFPPIDSERPARDGSRADDPVRILSVGRAVPKKGYDVLLKALSLLPATLHWRLDHVGGGELLPELRRLAESLGLADRITWHGPLAQEEVLERYRSADLFVLACRVGNDGDRDGLPNVLVEAASQRLASISTGVSGVPELIEDGQNGLLVTPDSPESLTAALERAIRDPDLRERLGRAAEAKVRESFDHKAGLEGLVRLFEQEWAKLP